MKRREKKSPNAIDSIEWNGETWYLYRGEKYYQRRGERLHRVAYKHYFGEIPKGYHVHHVDGNVKNNSPENLILLSQQDHMKLHMNEKERNDQQKQIAKASWKRLDRQRREWAKTEKGKAWYKEHWKNSIGKSMIPEERECAHCHQKFTSTAKHARFCSQNCKMKARTRRLKGLPEDAKFK